MQKFFKCEICGNLIGLIDNHHVPPECCGGEMTELVPNTVDASAEKHVPAVSVSEDGCCTKITVKIGSIAHPMEEKHNIAWVYVETESGGQRKSLPVGGTPETEFLLTGDKPLNVFAYCNLHGLWMTEI